jgi:hypothetical protein
MPRLKLSLLSTDKLQAEIQRRMKILPKLIRQRDELNRQIEALSGTVAEVKAPIAKAKPVRAAKGRRRRKARNEVSLTSALATALKDKGPLSVGEATEAVQKAGYKSNSKIFRTIVNQTLAKVKQFKKVGRGQYALA